MYCINRNIYNLDLNFKCNKRATINRSLMYKKSNYLKISNFLFNFNLYLYKISCISKNITLYNSVHFIWQLKHFTWSRFVVFLQTYLQNSQFIACTSTSTVSWFLLQVSFRASWDVQLFYKLSIWMFFFRWFSVWIFLE